MHGVFIFSHLDTVAGLSHHEGNEGRMACALNHFLGLIPRRSLPREWNQAAGVILSTKEVLPSVDKSQRIIVAGSWEEQCSIQRAKS